MQPNIKMAHLPNDLIYPLQPKLTHEPILMLANLSAKRLYRYLNASF